MDDEEKGLSGEILSRDELNENRVKNDYHKTRLFLFSADDNKRPVKIHGFPSNLREHKQKIQMRGPMIKTLLKSKEIDRKNMVLSIKRRNESLGYDLKKISQFTRISSTSPPR